MSVARHLFAAGLISAMIVSGALAQEKPSPAAAVDPAQTQGTTQDLEPAVNTSAPTDDAKTKRTPHAGTPSVPSAKSPTESAGAVPGKPHSGAKDRIDLDTTQITGNRELPKVLYIVPWKRSDLSDLAGRPSNSLLDEVLMPVDRDVFKRENRYYGALQPDEPHPGGSAAAAPAGAAAATHAADKPPARDEK